MNFVIRVDASVRIGSGHLMRCMTLADHLRERGGSISFMSRELTGNLLHLAEQKGYTVHRIPFPSNRLTKPQGNLSHAGLLEVDWQKDAEETKRILQRYDQPVDWLIVDHYAVDGRWESQMRPFTRKIMVIDDVADRPHDCDVLLDQNLYQDMDIRYDGLVPASCRKLLGPTFALLRPEFVEAQKKVRSRDGSIKRILVFFGGSDPTNETEKTLAAIRLLNRPEILVDVVVGISNQRKDIISALCSSLPNTRYYCQIDNIAEMLNNTDMVIGAGGATTWERCCLAVPTIVISVADNQINISKAAASAGAILYLGSSDSVTADELADQVRSIMREPDRLRELSRQAMYLVDGYGAERVVSALSVEA